MDKERLLYCLQKCEKQQQKRKRKRCFYTVSFYTVVLLLILYWLGQIGDSIGDIFVSALFCFIGSFVSYFINLEIFGRILQQEKDEDTALEYLRKRLREKEQENNH
jgi:cell division protein FtsB